MILLGRTTLSSIDAYFNAAIALPRANGTGADALL
jgi:hypothetical protein